MREGMKGNTGLREYRSQTLTDSVRDYGVMERCGDGVME
jgi:hypothetical protein